MAVQNGIVSIYTEATPNPQTMKFVLNRMVFPQNSADFPDSESAAQASPLASNLFNTFDYVQGVFIMNNFVTVTKSANSEWFEAIPALRDYIKNYVASGEPIVDEAALKTFLSNTEGGDPNQIQADDSETVAKIKEMLTKYVQPAVEMDGGSIVFKSFNEGVVTLGMQGSCSGCPSSTITLKSGIEGLLKRMVPGVESVEAQAL